MCFFNHRLLQFLDTWGLAGEFELFLFLFFKDLFNHLYVQLDWTEPRIPSDPEAVWLESVVIHPDLRGQGKIFHIHVRTLKVMFEYSDLRIKNNFKQKSFWTKLKFNSLSKVVTQQSMTIFCSTFATSSESTLPLIRYTLPLFFVKNWPSQKHVHNFLSALSSLLKKDNQREESQLVWSSPLWRVEPFRENKELKLNNWT